MKQITIYDLIPLLKKGWVACNSNGSWRWYKYKPQCRQRFGLWNTEYERNESCFASLTAFNIAPFDGDWKDSLIKVADRKKVAKKVVNHKKKKIVHKQGKGTAKEVFEYILDTFPIEASGFLSQEQVINDFEKWKARNND